MGASGLTESFLPIQKENLRKVDSQVQVTTAFGQREDQQLKEGLVIAASFYTDTTSVALSGRGQKLDMSV